MAKRGSGTLQERVARLSDRLSQEQVKAANELASTTHVDLLKLAYYFAAVHDDAIAAPEATAEVQV
jgi:hypothetical protein